MGRRYTDEEKDAMIRQMVEFGRANHFFTVKKLSAEFTKAYNDIVSETWIRQKYEMTLCEYMTQEGAIMDEARCREYANELYGNLLKAYEGKPKIELMTLDEAFDVKDPDFQVLQRFWVDPDEPERMTLARKLALDGVLKMPFETEEERKALIEQAVALTKEKLAKECASLYPDKSWTKHFGNKYIFMKDVLWDFTLPKCDFFGYYTVEFTEPYVGKRKKDLYRESVLRWIEEIHKVDVRTFFEQREILCTKEESNSLFRQYLEKLKTVASWKKKPKDLEGLQEIIDKLEHKADDLKTWERVPKNPDPALKLALEYDIPSIRWMKEYLEETVPECTGEKGASEAYLTQLFLREGILLSEEEIREAAEKAGPMPDVYEFLDRFDLDKVLKDLGITISERVKGFPKDQSFEVKLNEKAFKVQYKFTRKLNSLVSYGLTLTGWEYDAYEAISTMISREEMQEKWREEYPSSDGWVYATPEFKDDLQCLPEEIRVNRMKFLIAVAALLETAEMAQKIVEFAPKKKNGTFHKNRLVRIADSCLARNPDKTLGITGRTSDDSTIVVTVEDITEKPEVTEALSEDFINTHKQLFGFEKWVKE